MMVWFHLLVEMLEILLEVFDVVASCWTSHNDLDVQVDKPSEHRTHLHIMNHYKHWIRYLIRAWCWRERSG